jgi:hypothetical protein
MSKARIAATTAYLIAIAVALLYPRSTVQSIVPRPDPCRPMYRLDLRSKGCPSYPSDVAELPAPMTTVIQWKRQALVLTVLSATFGIVYCLIGPRKSLP